MAFQVHTMENVRATFFMGCRNALLIALILEAVGSLKLRPDSTRLLGVTSQTTFDLAIGELKRRIHVVIEEIGACELRS
jgi:O-succinylbenzoate synthase